MRFCENCKIGFNDELDVCPFCGNELSDAETSKVSGKEIQKEQQKEDINPDGNVLVDADQKEAERIEPYKEVGAAVPSEEVFQDEKVQDVSLGEKAGGVSAKKPKYGKMVGAVIFMVFAVVFFLIAIILILVYVTKTNDKSKTASLYIGIVFLCLEILFIVLNRIQVKKYKQSKS